MIEMSRLPGIRGEGGREPRGGGDENSRVPHLHLTDTNKNVLPVGGFPEAELGTAIRHFRPGRNLRLTKPTHCLGIRNGTGEGGGTGGGSFFPRGSRSALGTYAKKNVGPNIP